MKKLNSVEKEVREANIKLDLILEAVLEKKKMDNIAPANTPEELEILASNGGLVGVNQICNTIVFVFMIRPIIAFS